MGTAGLIPSRGSIAETEMCEHEVTEWLGQRQSSQSLLGTADRFCSQFLLLPSFQQCLFSHQKGKEILTDNNIPHGQCVICLYGFQVGFCPGTWVLLGMGSGDLLREL